MSDAALRQFLLSADLPLLMQQARDQRDLGHGGTQTYSRKVFIPLTKLCRDVCAYCTFAQTPRSGQPCYLDREAVLAIARAGAKAGCHEALFTLGDKPELRYAAARDELAKLGHESTLSYLAEVCELVATETGLLPHVNAGVMGAADIARLRKVSVSQGLMLESVSDRLCERGGPHFGSPDKVPAARLETIRLAGELAVPFTTGILVGIGETREERIDSLIAIRDLHQRYGHIQEVIIQNFRAKADTRMARHAEPDFDDFLWSVAAARLLLGPSMSIQAPPNLSPHGLDRLLDAGINDWGGISPVTIDHVNPEAAWPQVSSLAEHAAARGRVLVPRMAVYPDYIRKASQWIDSALVGPVLRASDAEQFARDDAWAPGTDAAPPPPRRALGAVGPVLAAVVAKALEGKDLDESEVVSLLHARDADFHHVCSAANELRKKTNGDTVTYVVNRNINYTNICSFRCKFCAFAKGKISEGLRGKPYQIDVDEVVRRAQEAWDRGATEICLQGGIHPSYTGDTYLAFCRGVRQAIPGMHIHAFSPLEIVQGARTLGIPVKDFLTTLKASGLRSLPGTAAEILDDSVRSVICPDKLNTQEWLDVVATAHEVGLRTTATIMFGHIEHSRHSARHLLRIRRLQQDTGGITEFVPLPFVPMEAPLFAKGGARRGPTFREAVLMHAVARLVLNPVIPNIQVSWVKMGPQGVRACLDAGVNDLGGTLMDESISRAAGSKNGQELTPAAMERLIQEAGRSPRQRTTLYGEPDMQRQQLARKAAPLHVPIQVQAHYASPSSGLVKAGEASQGCSQRMEHVDHG
ncbi:5-amino-6-(D-ribitylamino)uracil--L-tyrosine 4-hydroxyphenyl transferase [Cupriavidus laharis]|uniref:FO synthase n=1 Tax=Cupriavidus laharis TaxID=151654 RepID=A0ABM8X0L3_9BURK|nr:5-amino-6-(D-ribitylamino)uracil--L-tyrosine 4-hydroxyphenyl transferase CofH [Cupriavidus laharis]CAG9173415.1 5-amino-6-(D-ribitylamino)uracil--L-tyrosine 4-hydroxyphenyl transferase [Cupriavidus laharis]